MTTNNLKIVRFEKVMEEPKNRLNVYLIAICIALAIVNIIFLKGTELGFITTFFNNHFNDFLGGILILAYINFCLSFINHEIRSLKLLLIIMLLIAFVWEYLAVFIKPTSVFDYLDIITYLLACVCYWGMLTRLNKSE